MAAPAGRAPGVGRARRRTGGGRNGGGPAAGPPPAVWPVPGLVPALALSALVLSALSAVTAQPAADTDYRLDRTTLLRAVGIAGLRVLPETLADGAAARLWRRGGLRLLAFQQSAAFGDYRCAAPAPAPLRRAAAAVAAALERYPPGLVRRVGARFVILCDGLYDSAGNRPGGVPHPLLGVLLLDVGHLPASAFAGALHHEFYHLIDYAEDRSWSDPEWEQLNPIGFQYHGPDRRGYDSASDLGAGGRRFASAYGRASVAEDKAELFRWLLTEPATLARRARDDPGLARKLALLRLRLGALGFPPARWR